MDGTRRSPTSFVGVVEAKRVRATKQEPNKNPSRKETQPQQKKKEKKKKKKGKSGRWDHVTVFNPSRLLFYFIFFLCWRRATS
jgi:hypothetical protein